MENYSDEFDVIPQEESPEIPVTFLDGYKITLNWENTVLISYIEGNGAYDFAIYKNDDHKRTFIKFDQFNWDGLVSLGFPLYRFPKMSQETKEWFINWQMQDFDIEISDFLSDK